MRFAAVFLGVALCACGSKSGADAAVDLSRDLQGDFIDRYALPDGAILDAPLDVSTLTIRAFFDLPDGGSDSRTVTGGKDGTFVIRDVPQGRFNLSAKAQLVNTDARTIHLGQNKLGRSLAFLANPGEGYRMTASNIAPWTSGDELQFFSWNAGLGFFSTSQRNFSSNPPDAGDTALTAAFIDFGGLTVPEANRGDVLTITQLSTSALDGGGTVKAVTRAASVMKTLSLAAPTPLSFAFDVPPADATTLTMNTQRFLDFAGQLGPGAMPFSARMGLSAHPGSFDFTIADGVPDFVIAEVPLDGGPAVVSTAFANAFPEPAFTHFANAGVAAESSYALHTADGGNSFARSEVAAISVLALRSTAESSAMTVRVSPVRALKLDDQPIGASGPFTTSETPVLSWDLPEVGTVSRTIIDVLELSISAQTGATKRVVDGSITVTGAANRVHFPPGVLSAGRYYVLRVTVLSAEGLSAESPLRNVGPPLGSATTLSGVIAPQ